MRPADDSLPPHESRSSDERHDACQTPGPADETFVSVDIEASGPSPSTGSLIAIGACLVSDPGISFHRQMAPLADRPWDPAAERVHRLSREHLEAHGVMPDVAMADFAAWLDEACPGRPIFVGFNAPFDWMFVADAFHGYLGRNPFGISGLDLKALYMGRHGVERWAETSRRFVAARYGLRAELTHDALEDARAQAEIARLLLAPVSPSPGRLRRGLRA